MSLVLFILSTFSVFFLRTECQSLTFFSYELFGPAQNFRMPQNGDNIFKASRSQMLHHANFVNAFDLMSCQPSKASDTHSDIENGFSLHARTPPNTFNDNLSKKKMKIKKTS